MDCLQRQRHLALLGGIPQMSVVTDAYGTEIVLLRGFDTEPFSVHGQGWRDLQDRRWYAVGGQYEYEYLYEYYPSVVICPGRGQVILDGATLDIEYVGSS